MHIQHTHELGELSHAQTVTVKTRESCCDFSYRLHGGRYGKIQLKNVRVSIYKICFNGLNITRQIEEEELN